MNGLLLFCILTVAYMIAYKTYGGYLSKYIFQLNSKNDVPSQTLSDGQDYVPAQKQVLFGHHFTSIAGTGPIVGPAIGVIWGWGPALLWIFLGSIFMGAVHDLTTLVMSMRNQGKSIVDISKKYTNHRVRFIFFIVVFLALLIVIAIFGMVIALIFSQFPESVFPVWFQIPIAIWLGRTVLNHGVYRKKMIVQALLLMILGIWLGMEMPLHLPRLGIPETGIWTIVLLMYAFFASVLPVHFLLQPRDLINAWQLYISLGLVVLGLVATGISSGLPLVAPVINMQAEGAPNMWPFLFITVACGAISGFHCLISSGTTSKQIKCETDAHFIGYGAMITEAFLATVVIIAVSAGIGIAYESASGVLLTGRSAWDAHYGSWAASSGLGSKLTAVVVGCANMMSTLGISTQVGISIMGVFIASFAGTTLDSATRVQRYILSEFISLTPLKGKLNKYAITAIAVLSAAMLAFSSGADGKGALLLWPLFGAVNQLLGGLALLVGTLYLQKRGGRKWMVTAIPCLFLMITSIWASLINQIAFLQNGQSLLFLINGIIIGVSVLMSLEIGAISLRWRQAPSRPNQDVSGLSC